MKNFALKLSIFLAVITWLYCLISQVSVTESLLRGFIVFIGTYAILLVFFISLKFILQQRKIQRN